MKKLLTFAVLAALGIGVVGCGADIPTEEEIDPNPVADQDAMQRSMEEMMKRRQQANNGEDLGVDAAEAAKRSAGGDN